MGIICEINLSIQKTKKFTDFDSLYIVNHTKQAKIKKIGIKYFGKNFDYQMQMISNW